MTRQHSHRNTCQGISQIRRCSEFEIVPNSSMSQTQERTVVTEDAKRSQRLWRNVSSNFSHKQLMHGLHQPSSKSDWQDQTRECLTVFFFPRFLLGIYKGREKLSGIWLLLGRALNDSPCERVLGTPLFFIRIHCSGREAEFLLQPSGGRFLNNKKRTAEIGVFLSLWV